MLRAISCVSGEFAVLGSARQLASAPHLANSSSIGMTGPAGGNSRKRKGGSGDGQRGNGKKARGGGGGGWSSSNSNSNRYSYRQRSGEIRGPGIWFTCERNKEARAVAEAYDLLDEVSCAGWAGVEVSPES